MKFKWTEPLKAKRARDGGFSEIFRRKNLYSLAGILMLLFVIIWLTAGVEPDQTRIPFFEFFLFMLMIAFSISFFVSLILWAFPATIKVHEKGIIFQMGEEQNLDEWADISNVRIEQKPGWKALAYTVRGTEQKEWGISGKISAQELLNFMQRQQYRQ